ncbi:enoyl-CoA hydratase/isomerase family protein [Limnochorda pilosa]|uniref:Enoyl-CoA hydratase n=1 Tax=Limnochorda pilosa TaxID=1555112 RepID=A0A0K2SG62_LIMPI|nr:enoyl-CoA hydratase-related protein [Limnochorda pilosa]BAS26080.1 enoyl-CoA hydratase [Limnochorda pilosa]
MGLIEHELQEGVAVVRFNSPPVNALSQAFFEELARVVAWLEGTAGIRAALFTSAFPGVFMAGADLTEFQPAGGAGAPDAERLRARVWETIGMYHDLFGRIEALPYPTVAAINGHALGGGCEFSLACDFRLMVDDGRSEIGLPEVRLGLFPGGGGTQRLPRLIGEARAKELILRGWRLKAPEARQIGLVTDLYPAETFADQALDFTRRLALQATQALAFAKRNVHRSLEVPLSEGLKGEQEDFAAVVVTEDAREGIQAFFEGRKANFRGR